MPKRLPDNAGAPRRPGVGGLRRTRHAVDGDAALAQVQRLLATAPKDVRVAALEAQHACARVRKAAQQRVDLVLRARVEAGFLADVDHGRAAVDEPQDVRRDQPARARLLGRCCARRTTAAGSVQRGGGARLSYRTTSAVFMSCAARSVSRPGSPGPVPTRYTAPGPSARHAAASARRLGRPKLTFRGAGVQL